MQRGKDQEPLFPGEPRHENAEPDPDRRPAAVAGQQVPAVDPVHLAVGILIDNRDAFIVLGKGRYVRTEADIRDIVCADRRYRVPRQLPLFVLNGERKIGFVGDVFHVENRDDVLGLAVAELEGRRVQSALDNAVGKAETVQHFEGRRMNGRGARVLGRRLEGFENRHRNALLDQGEGGDHADRPAAADYDAIFVIHTLCLQPVSAGSGLAEYPHECSRMRHLVPYIRSPASPRPGRI